MILREPMLMDAKEMVRLVRESGVLDTNSDYAYLLMCEHFNETCVVAEYDGCIVGYTAGFRPPNRPDVLFVWQIGVAAEARGQGLATQMLDHLISRRSQSGVRFLEATVTPSNTASRALFRSVARRHGVECRITPQFLADVFSDPDGHEGEDLFHIGPLDSGG